MGITEGDDVDGDGLDWRASSFSDGEGESRIEVAFLPDGGVAIRDAKDDSLAPHRYTPAEWEAFVAGVHAGEFDRP